MTYVLWTLGIAFGAVILGVLLAVAAGMVNVWRTSWTYGDISSLNLRASQIRRFYKLIEAHFASRNLPVSIKDGVAYVTYAGDTEPHQLGLQNLAQMCYHSEEPEWAAVIDQHFSSLANMEKESDEILGDLENYEKIKSRLAVRLMPKMAVPLESMVYREDLEDTITNLVYDLPTSIRAVHIDEEKRWPVGLTKVFADAIENTRRLSTPEVEEADLGDGVKIFAITSNDNYVTTHALLLREHADWVGEHGALVAVPHRHALLIHPIRDASVIMAVQKLGAIATGMEKEGPGSITPNLYWYRDGKFINLPYDLTGKSFNFRPPGEFVELLGAIVPKEESAPE